MSERSPFAPPAEAPQPQSYEQALHEAYDANLAEDADLDDMKAIAGSGSKGPERAASPGDPLAIGREVIVPRLDPETNKIYKDGGWEIASERTEVMIGGQLVTAVYVKKVMENGIVGEKPVGVESILMLNPAEVEKEHVPLNLDKIMGRVAVSSSAVQENAGIHNPGAMKREAARTLPEPEPAVTEEQPGPYDHLFNPDYVAGPVDDARVETPESEFEKQNRLRRARDIAHNFSQQTGRIEDGGN